MYCYGVVFTGYVTQRTGTPNAEVAGVGFFGLHYVPEPLIGSDRPLLEDAARTQPGPHAR